MMDKALRLDKYLADMGIGTRSQVKDYLRRGRVTVNGQLCKQPEMKISPVKDAVTFDGGKVGYCFYEYYMLNKPQGVVSATEDKRYPTVVELIDEKMRKDLFPVGRLDVDTEGLLLITNDGALAHELLSPKKHVNKVYYVHARGILPEEAVSLFQDGIVLQNGTRCLPAGLEVLDSVAEENGLTKAMVTIHEGKFHQVKLMFLALGMEVVFLKRLCMGTLTLDETLSPGQYRPLSPEELKALKQIGGGMNV